MVNVMNDYIINNKEYTLVDSYPYKDGKVIQLNSDDDILLYYVDNDETTRTLTKEEYEEIRNKYNLNEYDYVTLTARDLFNLEFSAKSIDKDVEEDFKAFFMKSISSISYDLYESKYIINRIKEMKYKYNARGNGYLSNCVYLFNKKKVTSLKSWIPVHETIHGIVNKNKETTRAIIEGITDMYTGMIIPRGSFSQSHHLYEGEIQVNDSNYGQNHLVVFAKQLVYALGEEYNTYELLTHPHDQIKKFGEIYGKSKNRVLNHKLNKLYRENNIVAFKDAQKYMLEMIFDKKFENVVNQETAQEYFEELINFGLLRGRIEGKDDDLKEYYNKQLGKIKEKGIDKRIIPEYKEKEFYPKADVYLRYNSYLESSIKARREGKGEEFRIF